MNESLGKYRQKRDFSHTPEPEPQLRAQGKPLTFVVQKHHARQLHYDFRLELDGVLKSWSVPKGPSLDPDVKRLAVMVEDHPLDYASFEGVIPKGEYGAGEVIVWDKGVYSPDERGKFLFNSRDAAEREMNEGLKQGKISFFLRGNKLKGSWTLIKIQKRENDWLLIKHQDEYAQPGTDILQQERSVLSGWTIDNIGKSTLASPLLQSLNPAEVPGADAAPFPSSISPMLAYSRDAPFSSPDWIFEPKLDGYRLITYLKDGKVIMKSRRDIDVTQQYATLLPDISRQPASELILDGEIIAMDEKGRQCFQCLQQYLKSAQIKKRVVSAHIPLIYYVFDILYLDGYDLRNAALRYRKALLHNILRISDKVRLVDYFEGDADKVYAGAINAALEGVVAKHLDSRYETGKRSQDWLKIKEMRSDEFVIGGYTAGEGSRSDTFGALLLGYFDDHGKLKYAGNVGTGFDELMLNEIKNQMDALKIDKCPFSDPPLANGPVTWVSPMMVAEVKFSEWTRDGLLRIPVFIHLRADKSPAEVRKVEVVSTQTAAAAISSSTVENTIEQLQQPKGNFIIEVDNNRISLKNMDKVLWPSTEATAPVTKRHLLSYLAGVSPYLLRHLKDRPLTLNRFPDGIDGEHFYQRHWNNQVPDFVTRVTITGEDNTEGEYLVCDNLSTLLWLGQAGNLEFHSWFSRTTPEPGIPDFDSSGDSILDYPDYIIFDLDPYIYSGKELAGAEPELNRKAFDKVREVALWLKEVLDDLSLIPFVKTSGKTGLHIHIPILRSLDYKAVRSAAETIGRFLLQRHSKDITMDWAVKERSGRVFIDYAQNVRGKSLASVYSPRPTPQATVSTPVRWEELGKIYPTDFTVLNLLDRLKTTGDLWSGLLTTKQDLKKILGK